MSDLHQLIESLLAIPSVRDKVLIERTYEPLGDSVSTGLSAGEQVRLGDDCAAIPDGMGGYTLFASEGIIPAFLNRDPWFAGYSAVMVNISDVCAMGGLPVALTNVIWTPDQPGSRAVWEGMLAACRAYDVPMVGGHTCYGSDGLHLAVSIIGKAHRLLTSFDARPGEQLLIAVDMNGAFYGDYPFWNASTTASPNDLQRTLRLPHQIAQMGWSSAAKDISMGGIIGTLAMLTRTSGVGATLNLDALPIPPGVSLLKWLTSFPSYGYLLSVPDQYLQPTLDLFASNGITAATVGGITDEAGIQLAYNQQLVSFPLDEIMPAQSY
ncbi:sll0787 family AIR synthase-like protein [Spirosoma rhododendri]|uniref:Sll0787 family AIR synthase-like protein n=1 Tax=Spirosoma rhododendri TaxID=2728024 RepID=A0A7L5DNS3_9BACT|nr:sll0787 family AIR synthase-like protein [Spirosoma rhododendri]QJD80144.1 sll0787 family AIR synthase-like protein [Spirosoma rhododendri]